MNNVYTLKTYEAYRILRKLNKCNEVVLKGKREWLVKEIVREVLSENFRVVRRGGVIVVRRVESNWGL